jgi:hypothetical protein
VSPLAFVTDRARLREADTTAGAVVRFAGHCLQYIIFQSLNYGGKRLLELVKNVPGGIDFLNVSVYTNINQAGRAADCNQQGETNMTFYKVPAAIEKETEKAYLDENLGWLPKSAVELTEKDNNQMRWLYIPAWLAKQKGVNKYTPNTYVEER